jgi:hypothetical protein
MPLTTHIQNRSRKAFNAALRDLALAASAQRAAVIAAHREPAAFVAEAA